VSLAGFDGHEMADLLDLTTVSQPAEELGALAARALLDQLEDAGRQPCARQLPTQLHVRGSTSLRRRVGAAG
jgi:DNA-binding LacI/PurR family transcriptional regulator